jgi:hypothetical protein
LDSQQPSLELKRAIQTLEGACAQLTATVASPAHTMINVCRQPETIPDGI